MKLISIVAGGTLSEKFLSDIKKADYIIGVDRGAWWLLQNKITPQEAIGDFDSVTQEELAVLEESIPLVSKYPKEKDFTDLELALEKAVNLKSQQIIIYGGIGSRFDQTLASILVLERFSSQADIHIMDENNEIQFVDRQIDVIKDARFFYYSLISVTDKAVVTLKGFAYPLHEGIISRASTLGVSNELKEKKGSITVHEGKILLIKSSG